MSLLYHAYVYLEFLILACTIYILAPTIVDSNGKTVTIQGTDGTVYVQGDSEYTITTGSYSDTADMSGATAIQDQSVYTVEKPDQL